MPFFRLNNDIISELLRFLDISDTVSLLCTCKYAWSSLVLWQWTLKARQLSGPLSCPLGLNIFSLDLPNLRRIAFKTSGLYSNWSSRYPVYKSLKTFQRRSSEELLCTIPSTDIALTISFQRQPNDPRVCLRCLDLRDGRELGRFPVWSRWLTQYGGHQIYDGTFGHFTMAFVTQSQHQEGTETLLHILKVDYTNRRAVIMDGTHRITLENYHRMRAAQEFRLHITERTITMVAPLVNNRAIAYLHIEPDKLEPLAFVKLSQVSVDFGSLGNSPLLLEFFLDSEMWIHVILKAPKSSETPTLLLSCSFPILSDHSSPNPARLETLEFPPWLAPSMSTLGSIFDVYDLSHSHSGEPGPSLLLVQVPEITFCPMKIIDGRVVPWVEPGHHLDLQAPIPEETSVRANTVAFTTHTALGTLNQPGGTGNVLGRLQLLVYHPLVPEWTTHDLVLPPEVNVHEFLADGGTYDLDQHQGSVILWGKDGKVHVVSYV